MQVAEFVAFVKTASAAVHQVAVCKVVAAAPSEDSGVDSA